MPVHYVLEVIDGQFLATFYDFAEVCWVIRGDQINVAEIVVLDLKITWLLHLITVLS